MITIKVNIDSALSGLDRMARGVQDTSPLMADLADALASESERQFAAQSGPLGQWAILRPVTQRMRERRGTWPGKMLQVTSGGLAASVQTKSDRATATIGSNKVYAAIHQFGGVTSPKSMIPGKTIPARPYLPFNPRTHQLTREAEQEVQERIAEWAADLGFK